MKVAGKQIQEKAVLYERVDHGRYFSGGVKVKVHTDIVVPKPLHQEGVFHVHVDLGLGYSY